MKNTREERIIKLLEPLAAQVIEVVNDSARHSGHAGDNGTGETHYILKIRAAVFAGKSRVECQQMVYALLMPEFSSGLHALSLEIKTVD